MMTPASNGGIMAWESVKFIVYKLDAQMNNNCISIGWFNSMTYDAVRVHINYHKSTATYLSHVTWELCPVNPITRHTRHASLQVLVSMISGPRSKLVVTLNISDCNILSLLWQRPQ